MLSYFDILIFMTTPTDIESFVKTLWFAFVLWYSDIYDNNPFGTEESNKVVICFRTLIFWYLWQLLLMVGLQVKRCDLLSYFDILIFMTTLAKYSSRTQRLWFAFVLWYSDIYDNNIDGGYTMALVVICFRTLIFWYLWQLYCGYAE